MRVVVFALSVVAGVVLFFLFAKLLVAGLFFALGLALFGFFIKKLRRLRYGYRSQHSDWPDHWTRYRAGYRYPALQRFEEWQDDGRQRYRTITIQ